MGLVLFYDSRFVLVSDTVLNGVLVFVLDLLDSSLLIRCLWPTGTEKKTCLGIGLVLFGDLVIALNVTSL